MFLRIALVNEYVCTNALNKMVRDHAGRCVGHADVVSGRVGGSYITDDLWSRADDVI